MQTHLLSKVFMAVFSESTQNIDIAIKDHATPGLQIFLSRKLSGTSREEEEI